MKLSGIELLLLVILGMLVVLTYEVIRLRMVQEDRPRPSLMAALGTGSGLASLVVGAILIKYL